MVLESLTRVDKWWNDANAFVRQQNGQELGDWK